MQDAYANMLTTPIKKIRELSIKSPDDDTNAPSIGFFSSVNRQVNVEQRSSQELMTFQRQDLISPIRYPSMSEFHVKPVPLEQISQRMLDRGYSKTLSNKVLKELDIRANEITRAIANGRSTTTRPSSAKFKRYSHLHKPSFGKMESISSHYAATRVASSNHRSNELLSSASKKRRTLNGPEEIFAAEKENESPVRRKEPSEKAKRDTAPSSSKPFLGAIPLLTAGSSKPITLTSSPYRDLDRRPYVLSQISPTRTLDPASQSSSPTRCTRISPSKGSMNLNQILLGDRAYEESEGFVKIRQTSLQMAGVLAETGLRGIPLLLRASTSSLQKKTSLSNKQRLCGSEKKSPSLALHRSSAFSLLLKVSSYPLSESSSVKSRTELVRMQGDTNPSLTNKTLTQLMQNRGFARQTASSAQLNKKSPLTPLSRSSQLLQPNRSSSKSTNTRPIYNNLPNLSSQRSMNLKYGKLLDPSLKESPSTLSVLSVHTNGSIPTTFSLYNKPTISSSQKSFGAVRPSANLRSLALNLSSRSVLSKNLAYKNSFA